MKTPLIVIVCSILCSPAMAADSVVFGRALSNSGMTYVKDECPENHICLHSWYKWVIRVDKTVSGPAVSRGRIVAARMQHTSMESPYTKRLRLFVLRPIEETEQRELLRADYYLEDMSAAQRMFCLTQDPKEVGLVVEGTYKNAKDSREHCFELDENRND